MCLEIRKLAAMIHQTTEGLHLYYEVHGKKDAKTTLIFLNGLTQSTVAWGLTIPYLISDYQVVLLDLVLQGQSDKETEWRTFDQHAADVKGLVDSLKLNDVVLLGLSYGGMVAQHFAVKYPDSIKKLVLMATLAHKTPIFDAIGNSWWKALESGGYPLMLDVMLPAVLSEGYFKNPLIPIDAMKDARLQSGINPAAIVKLMKATDAREDFREKLKSIKIPTLIIHGEKDFLLPLEFPQEIHRNIPGSRLEIIKHAGHTLNLEAVPQIVALIKDFVK